MKRFVYTSQYRHKIIELVDFPITGLDLGEYVKLSNTAVSPLYDLYAVSQHSGGLGGGHCTAICQNVISKEWNKHNDR